MKGLWSGAPSLGGDGGGAYGPLSPRTVTPNLRHSPTMRRLPQRGFSRAKRRTMSTTSSSRALGVELLRFG
jgi:hypothetical protein